VIIKQFFILILCMLAALEAGADVGVSAGISPLDDYSLRREKQLVRPADAFVKALAKHLEQNQDELTGLWNRGYGRNEMIKLILISKRSGVALKDITKQRDKGVKLLQLCEKYSINYADLLGEAKIVRTKVDVRARSFEPEIHYGVMRSSSAGVNISTSAATGQ